MIQDRLCFVVLALAYQWLEFAHGVGYGRRIQPIALPLLKPSLQPLHLLPDGSWHVRLE